MQPLGKVVNITKRGHVVARGASQPRLGWRVLDQRGRDIGKVSDLIGPVREPYILVAPQKGADVRRLLGQELFTR